MTADEIHKELKRLGKTAPEFDERGERLAKIAIGQGDSQEPAFQWLSGQWITSFASLPRVAAQGIARQYDLVLHIFGIAHAMDKCGFPDSGLFVAHAREIRGTFETIATLENMLADIEEGRADEPLH